MALKDYLGAQFLGVLASYQSEGIVHHIGVVYLRRNNQIDFYIPRGHGLAPGSLVTLHLDNRDPARRKAVFALWEELLLSAADQLIAAGKVDAATVDGMRGEFARVQSNPDAVFFYSFVQARAVVY